MLCLQFESQTADYMSIITGPFHNISSVIKPLPFFSLTFWSNLKICLSVYESFRMLQLGYVAVRPMGVCLLYRRIHNLIQGRMSVFPVPIPFFSLLFTIGVIVKMRFLAWVFIKYRTRYYTEELWVSLCHHFREIHKCQDLQSSRLYCSETQRLPRYKFFFRYISVCSRPYYP